MTTAATVSRSAQGGAFLDEGVQIHGGYGYHQDYAVERAYRDARINRIFEGTNEINRLIITSMLLKRAARGQSPLLGQAEAALKQFHAAGDQGSDEDMRLVANAKQLALIILGIAARKFGTRLEKEQEVVMSISDIIMQVFAMESSLLRQRKLAARGAATNAAEMCAVFLCEAMDQIEISARKVIGACSHCGDLRQEAESVRKLARYDPVDAIAIRRSITRRVLDAERYVV